MLGKKQSGLEDEPEEGPGCKGKSFASDKGTFAFSLETSKRELEGWGRRGEGGRVGRCGR